MNLCQDNLQTNHKYKHRDSIWSINTQKQQNLTFIATMNNTIPLLNQLIIQKKNYRLNKIYEIDVFPNSVYLSIPHYF